MAEIVIKLANGKEAGNTVQGLRKDINQLTKATEKLEIGSEQYNKNMDELKAKRAVLDDHYKQLKSVSKASETWKNQIGGILGQIPGFSQLSGVFGSLQGGVGGLTSGFGLLKGALIAIPIFAFVAAVTALVGWFSKTEKGANVLSGVFKGMGAVLDTLMNRLWNIGTTLKELFSNPIQFFKNLGNDIVNAAKEGYDLVKVFDDIEDRQRELDVRAKEQENQIDRMLLQSKNVATSYQERIKLLDEADKKTRSAYQEQLNLSKEYLAAVERETIQQLTSQGAIIDSKKDLLLQDAITGEQADKLRDARLKLLDIQGQEIAMEEKIQNRRDQILTKQEKAQDKANADAEKQRDKEQKDLESSLKKLEELRVQAIVDSEQQEIAAVNLKFQRELESLTLQGEQRLEAEKLAEEARGQEIQAIHDKYAKQKAEAEQKARDEKEKADKEASDKAKQTAKEQADFERALNDAKLGLASTALGATISLLGEDEKARKKNAEAIKAFTIAQIITDTQREIAGYYANPASTGTLGAVGSLKAVGALIRAGVAIAKVSAQKFALGGPVIGPSHSGGGVPIEAEGGEFIFSRKAVQAIGMPTLNAINRRYTFANGGPVNPYGDRGPMPSGAAGGGDPFAAMERLEKTFLAYADAMDKRIDRIQVQNNVQDTMKGIKVLNTLKSEWDV